jgi:hypothetical protein
VEEPCVYKKVSGSGVSFLIFYVNDISLLQIVKIWLSNNFFMKDIKEATYIIGIKIYKVRSKRLLELSQSMYIGKMLKQFSMKESKRKYIRISYKIRLSNDMFPKT